MNKIDARLEKMSENLATLSAKAAAAAEEAKTVREAREEAISEQISTVKGDVAAFQENVRIASEEGRSKIASALLKIQMTIKENIRERRQSKDQFLTQVYVAEQLDYIDECFAIAAYLVNEAQLAMYDTMEAVREYEEKYGRMGDAGVEEESAGEQEG